MKSMTIYKGLKFKDNTLTFNGELLHKFRNVSVVDEYAIEDTLIKLQRQIKDYRSVMNRFKEVVNHKITIEPNGVILELESMFERESIPLREKLYFNIFNNSVILV